MKRILPVFGAALLLTAGLLAAQPGHFGGHRGMMGPGGMQAMSDHLVQALGLSAAQQVTFKQLTTKLQATVQPLFTAERQKHDAIREALNSDSPDAEAIGQLTIDAHNIQLQIRAARDQFNKDLTAILTPDQAKKLADLHSRMHHGPDDADAPPPPPGE